MPDDGSVSIEDVSNDLGCLCLWGPRAREVVNAVSDDDFSNEAFPYRGARHVTIGGVPVLAVRLSYVGELGWELYVPNDRGADLWDALWEAGRPHGLIAAGTAAVLAEAGSDLILLEYVSTVEEATTLVSAAAETGLPVFLGLKHFDADGTMAFKEDAADAARAVEGLPVAAVLDMCSPPEEITAVFPRIRQAFEGPIGAYANIGYRGDPKAPGDSSRQWHRIDVGENSPDRYAEYARGWLAEGAQIIGGCCASGPEHIAALRPLLQ